MTAVAAGSHQVIRMLHTSDIHIGDTFARTDAVGALVDLALDHEIDVMVIVGDLFDHNRLETAVGQSVLDEFRRLPVPIIVVPGNHDPLMAGTIYERVEMPDHVRLISEPSGETVTLPALDLDIWGKPHLSYDDNRPLVGLPPRGASTWQVALAHGQLVLGAGDLHRSYLITSEEIAASDRDYVALGHWDVPRDVSAGPVAASYSGSPSRKSVCALVTLSFDGEERRVQVESLPVGAFVER
jgi:DNA repair exonuclease SbcCD nuclease subunit